MKKMTRRDFLSKSLKTGAGLSLMPLTYSCTRSRSIGSTAKKKMIVLGIDGMDPFFLRQFVMEGSMPNFLRLIHQGDFKKMRSSVPPQSPVAWSNFAVGASPAVHGIYDFIHRDPKTMIPYLSTSQVSESSNTFSFGDWQIPLSGGTVSQLREGKPFWEYLGEREIPTTVFKLPSNFPVISKTARCVSGMGTPDLLGTYGTFSFFTTDRTRSDEKLTGGKVFLTDIVNNKIVTELSGPANTLRKDRPKVRVPIIIWRDPQNEVVKIKLEDHELIMSKGEWSDWLEIGFDLVPHLKSIKGICKFHIKSVHPHFEMYVSPINIDPSDQALPVTSPVEYGRELSRHVGLFGTKGLPADTKALQYDILSENEYLQTSGQIYEESRNLMQYEISRLEAESSGLLFFYYSNLDQDSHMFWRAIDKKHPMYNSSLAKEYSQVIKEFYSKMDSVLGDIYEACDLGDDNFSLIVMSDHGFAPFYRSVNLNSWLLESSLVSLLDYNDRDKYSFFENVDWSNTKAYGLGINGLYINMQGRERFGTVPRGEAPQLISKLKKELLNLKDPQSGENAVTSVWLGKEIYGRDDDKTPDIIVGWNRGYRASWDTVLGGFPEQVFLDNDDKWSGDHCIDPFWVPASLLSNRKIALARPSIPDVTATILSEFNIPIPEQMTGKPLYDV